MVLWGIVSRCVVDGEENELEESGLVRELELVMEGGLAESSEVEEGGGGGRGAGLIMYVQFS